MVHFAYNEELCPSDPALCTLAELEGLNLEYNNNIKNTDVVFLDQINGDYRLDVINILATTAGFDLSNYFTVDINGTLRFSPWSVGAILAP